MATYRIKKKKLSNQLLAGNITWRFKPLKKCRILKSSDLQQTKQDLFSITIAINPTIFPYFSFILYVGLFLYQIKFLNKKFPVYYLLFMKIHNHERLEFVQYESSLLCLNRFWDFSFLATRTAINIPEQNKYGSTRYVYSCP